MARKTIEGYAVVKRMDSRTFSIRGIGIDQDSAWRDAAAQYHSVHIDAREYVARNPDARCVEAKITVTFEAPGYLVPEEVRPA